MADEPQTPEAPAPAEPASPAPAPAPTPIITPDTPAPSTPETPAVPEIKLSDLAKVAKSFPKALDYPDEIQQKAKDRGLSLEDAAVIVLHEKGELATPAAPADRSSGFGGTMDNPPPREAGVPAMGTPEAAAYWADKFKELEAKGEILAT